MASSFGAGVELPAESARYNLRSSCESNEQGGLPIQDRSDWEKGRSAHVDARVGGSTHGTRPNGRDESRMSTRTVVKSSDKRPWARIAARRVRGSRLHPADRREDDGKPGATCMVCRTGRLEYDGLFNLVCGQCDHVTQSASFT